MLKDKNLSLVILAGGRSQRMGRDKAELIYQGKTFLDHQIEKGLSLGITDILVSGYRGRDCRFPVIPDRYPQKGPLGGLEACFRKAKHAHCLVLSVDAPFIPVSELENLIRVYEGSEKRAAILKAVGREQPLIGVYEVNLADDMEREFLERKGSVFALLNRITYETYESPQNAEYFVNINDPVSYQTYCMDLK